jgi:hypothetical protein
MGTALATESISKSYSKGEAAFIAPHNISFAIKGRGSTTHMITTFLAGTVPDYRVSKKEPTEALRYE